ncbi:hypothetical protein tb265_43390 [Gemmatimonadetes bacterium T265]|nr:hypothetical protein tb265_43390 [Gemmatimonadetes bacterium T265]
MKSVAKAIRDRVSNVSLPRRVGPVDGGEPTLEHPVSQLATQGQCESPLYRAWCLRMKMDPAPAHHRYNRKLWEWVYILEVLQQRGLLRDGMRGLGFGVGTEPLTAVMADLGCRVVATDLPVEDAKSAGWVASDQHASTLEALNGAGICDPERFRRAVTYRAMDMTRIDPDLRDFDFTWSSCSLEHLGSLKAGMRFVENSLRCLKPGGVAVHTTEYNVLSNTRTMTGFPTVLYRRRDILALADRLRKAGHQITLNLNPGAGAVDQYHDVPPYYRQGHHLKLVAGEFVATSIGLVVTN